MGFSIDTLSQFAAGMMPLEEFREDVVRVLIAEAPQVTTEADGSLSAAFPLMADWAMYLDMVTDRDDPSFGESEARRLAGAMCAILEQVEDDEIRKWVSEIARWAPATVEAIRNYDGGTWSRDAFLRFLARRPWSEGQRKAVEALDGYALVRLADALEVNDYRRVVEALME